MIDQDATEGPERRQSTAGGTLLAGVAFVSALAAAALLAPLAGFAQPVAGGWGIAPLIAGLGCLALAWRRDRRLALLVGRAERLGDVAGRGASLDRLDRGLDAAEDRLASVEQRLAHRHPASGLPTREPLFAAIEQGLEGAGGVLGLVSLLDFERLTAFDPALADRVLVTLVGRMSRMLGQRRLIAQIDRARLAIWYDEHVPTEAACAQLEALGYALGGPIRDGEKEILPEVRIGHAIAPQDGASPAALLARAIAALAAGDEPPDVETDPVEAARQRYVLEQDLRRAIERGEFELHFQPLIDAREGCVAGAEALLRWHHPVQGAIPPSRFVPIIEQAGLASEVGLWVLNAACREVRGWQRQGMAGLRVAVNVSGHQLERADLAQAIQRTLARHSLEPDSLEVELTETVATADTVGATRLFERLRELGVAIAIDDFGTGFSSFSALRTLSFDKIKIDREFVTAVDRRRDSQAICRAILALGQGLGIRVLAEGVERAEEYAWLRREGCVHFQGFYFAPPLASQAFRAFVADRAPLARLLAPSLQLERLRA